MNDRHHMVDILFLLTLFGLFVLSAFLLLVMGSSIYTKTVASMEKNYDARTSVLYLNEKLRQHDSQGSVTVRDVGGQSALVLRTEVEGASFYTWVFVSGGHLREVLSGEDAEIEPYDGEIIMPLADMDIGPLSGGMLSITVVDKHGGTSTLYWYQRSGKMSGGAL